MTTPTVLLTDDEDDIRAVASLSLSAIAGWNVLEARSGAEALELAQGNLPDLILLDVMMPGLDGIDTLARLRSDPRTEAIPVVFLTARVQRKEIDHYLQIGALGVIQKPFDPMTLSQKVRDLTKGQLQ